MVYCLSIAGADPSSGAGIQADIRTFESCGVYPFSIITAITYQTGRQFYGYSAVSEEVLRRQLDVILNSYPIEYVKIGMIPNIQTLNTIVSYLKKFRLKAVYDPVTISSAGKRLSSENLEVEIEHKLFPNIKILTPNLLEAELYSSKELTKKNFNTIEELKEAAVEILKKMYKPNPLFSPENQEKAVIIKSGRIEENKLVDLLVINKRIESIFKLDYKSYIKDKILLEGNIHGTGCVFSSSIAAFLSQNNPIEGAVSLAEDFFDEKFKKAVELSDKGKVIRFGYNQDQLKVINQIKRIYNYISSFKKCTRLIPEVRMNISGGLPNALTKEEIAGIEGRITIINGFPRASGEIKFGVSDHTARLLLSAKQIDNSINYVINLKYDPILIKEIQSKTELKIHEFTRESQPEIVKKMEHSTMQWIFQEYAKTTGEKNVPDIIWDKGDVGKEPMIRVFGKNAEDLLKKLQQIISLFSD